MILYTFTLVAPYNTSSSSYTIHTAPKTYKHPLESFSHEHRLSEHTLPNLNDLPQASRPPVVFGLPQHITSQTHVHTRTCAQTLHQLQRMVSCHVWYKYLPNWYKYLATSWRSMEKIEFIFLLARTLASAKACDHAIA